MLVIAHRMPLASARATTASAALAAADLAAAGADVFEIDLQLAGRRLVCSHATALFPASAVLSRLRHDGARLSWARQAPGRSLDTTLEVVPADARALLDLKDDRGESAFALAAAVASAGLDPGRTLASSKHWPSLNLLADAGFGVWRSVSDPAGLRRLLAQQTPTEAPAGSGVTIRHRYLTRELIADLKRFGLVVAWTVNDVRCAVRLVEWGVDGVTTDRPQVMHAVRVASRPR